MQSTARRIVELEGAAMDERVIGEAGKPAGPTRRLGAGVGLGLQHLAPAVEAGRAQVVAQMDLAGGRLDGDAGLGERVVRTVHAALGGRLLVLLNGHG